MFASPDENNVPSTKSPSPLLQLIFLQFLLDASKVHSKMKVLFSILEADSYISELANTYKG